MLTTFEKVLLGNVAFGGAYKVGILWNAEIDHMPEDPSKPKRRPMLMGEKIAAFLWGTAMSPVLTPLWVCHQLNYLDIYMQGKKPKDFGFDVHRRTFLDYVFT